MACQKEFAEGNTCLMMEIKVEEEQIEERQVEERQVDRTWISKFAGYAALTVLILMTLYFPVSYLYNMMDISQNIPSSDDYSLLEHLRDSRMQRFVNLFKSCDIHRNMTTKLAAEILYGIMKHLDFRYLTIIGNSALIGILVILLSAGVRYGLPRAVLPVFAALMFTPYYWNSMVWGFSAVESTWIHLYAALAFWSFFHADGRWKLMASLAFSVLAVYTRADGILVILVILIMQTVDIVEYYRAHRSFDRQLLRQSIIVLAVFVLLAAFLFVIPLLTGQVKSHLYGEAALGDKSLPGLIVHVSEIFLFGSALLGGVFQGAYSFQSGSIQYPLMSIAAGMTMLYFMIMFLGSRSVRKDTPFFHALTAFLLISSFAIAAGRVTQGIHTALSPRYMLNSIIVAILLLAMAIRSLKDKRAVMALCAILFIVVSVNFFERLVAARIFCQYFMHESHREMSILLTAADKELAKLLESSTLVPYDQEVLFAAIRRGIYLPPPCISESFDLNLITGRLDEL